MFRQSRTARKRYRLREENGKKEERLRERGDTEAKISL